MKFKGTKGEWKIDPLNKISIVDDSTDMVKNLICQTNGKSGEEREANAKIIAAAPELLLALEMAVMVMPNGHTRNECIAVIKKATE